MIRINYPESATRLNDRETEVQVRIWEEIFKDFEGKMVFAALKVYLATPGNKYAPKPGDLIGIIEKRMKIENKGLDKYEAWDIVEAMLRSKEFSWDPSTAFNKLPDPVRKACGSVGNLTRLSRSDGGELPFFKRDFIKRYEVIEKRDSDRRQLGMPELPAPKARTDEDVQREFGDEISKIIERLKGKEKKNGDA